IGCTNSRAPQEQALRLGLGTCFLARATASGEPMSVLQSSISTRDERFKANAAAMGRLTTELRERLTIAAQGGDERSRQRHTERGKLLPRERVNRLVDPGAPFLELSPLAAN